MKLTPEQSAWLANQLEKYGGRVSMLTGKFNINPCLITFGAGPPGVTCKNCVHLVTHCRGKFHKCLLRGITSGPGTDHRVRWPACARYEEKKLEKSKNSS